MTLASFVPGGWFKSCCCNRISCEGRGRKRDASHKAEEHSSSFSAKLWWPYIPRQWLHLSWRSAWWERQRIFSWIKTITLEDFWPRIPFPHTPLKTSSSGKIVSPPFPILSSPWRLWEGHCLKHDLFSNLISTWAPLMLGIQCTSQSMLSNNWMYDMYHLLLTCSHH